MLVALGAAGPPAGALPDGALPDGALPDGALPPAGALPAGGTVPGLGRAAGPAGPRPRGPGPAGPTPGFGAEVEIATVVASRLVPLLSTVPSACTKRPAVTALSDEALPARVYFVDELTEIWRVKPSGSFTVIVSPETPVTVPSRCGLGTGGVAGRAGAEDVPVDEPVGVEPGPEASAVAAFATTAPPPMSPAVARPATRYRRGRDGADMGQPFVGGLSGAAGV